MKITLKQLTIFIEVAERGSMLRAATVLNITPQAVSMQIRSIESEFGLSLFDREKRQLALSMAGKYVMRYAKRVLTDVRETEIAIACFKRLERGLLTIGIMRTAEYFVPRILARFQRKYPHIDVNIRVAANRAHLIELMDAAEVELSVMTRPPTGPEACSEPFARNPLVFVCSPRHRILGHKSVSAKVIDEQPFIVRDQRAGTRAVMEAFLTEHQCTPIIRMEISSNETIKHVVMEGLGLGFMSLHTIGLELRAGLLRIIDVQDTPIMGTWTVVHLHSRILSPGAEAFRKFILTQGARELRAHNAKLLSLGSKKRKRALH